MIKLQLLLIGLFLFFQSCSSPLKQKNEHEKETSSKHVSSTPKSHKIDTHQINLIETSKVKETTFEDEILSHTDTTKLFINDSLNFAYKAICDRNEQLIHLKFYKKSNDDWVFDYSIDSLNSQWGQDSLELMDFNFDGIYDARLYSVTGGRGANGYYHVLLRNKNSGKFKKLKYLDMPPNIIPNSKTNKVEATRFYGKTMFEEHTIIGDSLIQLNSVEVWYEGDWTFRKHEKYTNGKPSFEKLDSIRDEGLSTYSKEL